MSTTFTGALSSEWHTAGNWTAGVPTSGVDAVFTALSPNCHLDFNLGTGFGECRAIDMTGYTGALSSSNGPPAFFLRAHGNVTLGASTGALAIQVYGTCTLTTNGRVLYYLNENNSASLTLADNCTETSGLSEIQTGSVNWNGKAFTTPGDFTIDAGVTVTGLAGSVFTIGGNFVTSTDMIGSAAWTLDVTGTNVAHDATIAYCDASGGTEFDTTDNCVDGGNNINTSFPGAPAPTVSSIASARGISLGGTPVKILGSDFVAVSGVTIGGQPATNVVQVSSTEIRCNTPAHANGATDVVVTNGDAQTGTLAGGFTYFSFAPSALGDIGLDPVLYFLEWGYQPGKHSR